MVIVSSALIQKLPQSTIQMIAAGEVITRPVSAIKELLENSLDAGSTNIRISIDSSGLKLIEIIDNGHGIALKNAPMLCRRYATSKLSTADDLNRISTFGFRGEALASISEISELTVRTFNMGEDQMGWEASYNGGVIVGQPCKKYLQNPGTQIKITKLFESIAGRKSSMMLNLQDERKAIVELVQRYAIHHRDRVTICLKESHSHDLVNVLAPMNLKPCLGMFFGIDVENNAEGLEITTERPYKASIHVVFSYKKATSGYHGCPFILFVNDRLVDCAELKREINAMIGERFNSRQYQTVLYINLKVPSCDVDVNTHPAKATVALHYQSEIIASIVESLRSKLQENLATQTIDIGVSQQKTIGQLVKSMPNSQKLCSSQTDTNRLAVLAPNCLTQLLASPVTPTPVKRQYDLVHNDSSQLSLAQYSAVNKTRPVEILTVEKMSSSPPHEITLPDDPVELAKPVRKQDIIVDTPHFRPAFMYAPTRQRRDLKLSSITELRHQVSKEKSKTSLNIVKDSTFVGLFDHERALIQHETRLYAINLKAYLKEQHYQFYLFDFGNFPPIEVMPPGNRMFPLIDSYLDDLQEHELARFKKLKYNTTQSVIDELLTHTAMYEDYLALNLNRELIVTLPCIIPDEIPNLVFLGRFLVALANEIDYTDERECFRMIGRALAEFYSEPPVNLKDKEVHRKYHDLVETKLYGVIKNYLLIPEWLFTKENICQISDTKDLYKVFERC